MWKAGHTHSVHYNVASSGCLKVLGDGRVDGRTKDPSICTSANSVIIREVGETRALRYSGLCNHCAAEYPETID